jgi:VWFA-related protein
MLLNSNPDSNHSLPRTAQCRIARMMFSMCGVLALCSAPLLAADLTEYTVRSSANEVRISFAVSDRDGRAVHMLRSTDVAVADNGTIIRHFRSFRPATESPLDLVLLLDASDSVASQVPQEIAEVESFVQSRVWGERDRVSILSFGGLLPQLICARNCRGQEAAAKLNALRAHGATPLYDALLQATEILKESRDPESRPAMILFSDGEDTVSIHSFTDVTQAAQNLQAAIYAVDTRNAKYASEKGEAVLHWLAAYTGGLSFDPGQNVKSTLRMVVDDLQSGYVLTYDLPEKTSGQHSVKLVPTSDPRLRFRSRQAYDDRAYE